MGSQYEFNDGVLVPNTELGHIEIDGRDYETRAAFSVIRAQRGRSLGPDQALHSPEHSADPAVTPALEIDERG